MAASSNHSPHHSPRHSGGGGDASASPKSKRGAVARGVVSPWTHVVRSSESESFISSTPPAAVAAAVAAPSSPLASQGQQTNNSSPDWAPSNTAAAAASFSSSLSSADDSSAVAQPESFDNGSGSGNAAKKPAWNKPSNDDVEVGPVMGAVSWPALSESARASPKSSSSDPFKATSDGLVSVSQGNGIASSTQKLVINSNTNPSLLSNNMTPTRQKSMKRGGGSSSGNVTANGGFPQPAPPLGPVPEMSSNDTGKPGSVVPESSPRGHAHKESGHRGGFGSQSHSGNEHSQQRNSFRRGNGGPHPRGDGSFHHNGGKRDQDRGNPEWNSHRSFNGRDSNMQTQRVVPRGFIRPPSHVSTPFIPPPPMPVPVRHFGNPLLYPDIPPPVYYVPAPPPDSLRGVPMVAPLPPHTMLFPVMDPQLHTKIVNQIDYYFSNENLIKDTFLRKNMDDQGWVPINLIASFKKVMLLTNNVQLILDAVRTSSIVEVKDDKVRKRDDWFRWIMPSVQLPNTVVSSPQSLGRTSHDMLSATIHNLSLDERTNKQGDTTFLSRSSSGDLNSQPQLSSVEGTGQATFQAAYERSTPTRSSSN